MDDLLRRAYHEFCVRMIWSMGVVRSKSDQLTLRIPFKTFPYRAKIKSVRDMYNLEVSKFFSCCDSRTINALIDDHALPSKLDVGNKSHPFYLKDDIVLMSDDEYNQHVRDVCKDFLMRTTYYPQDTETKIDADVKVIIKEAEMFQSFIDDINQPGSAD